MKDAEYPMSLDESGVRRSICEGRRTVVKVGSSSLSGEHGGIDHAKVAALVSALADLHDAGHDVVLISSGAISAALAPLKMRRRPRDLAHQQAAAAVGQGLLMHTYNALFSERGILTGQVLLTVDDVTYRDNYDNVVRTLSTLLRMGVVPIINENDTVATHEIRFGDNDRLAALVAHVVKATGLVLLSDVNGVYTAHPDDPDARQITFVDDVEHLQVDAHSKGSSLGSGGMRTKLQAAQMAASAGIPVVLAKASDAHIALSGGQAGTAFSPIDKLRPRRMLWLAHACVARGALRIDDGAVRAVRDRGASLLAAGITQVDGDFLAGDPVNICTSTGEVIARGVVGFDSQEIPAMIGHSTAELGATMGSDYQRPVVHRDVLILLNHSGGWIDA